MNATDYPATGKRDACLHLNNVEQSIPAIFDEIVRLQAHCKAVGSDAWEPDYRDLNSVANRLGNFILSRGGAVGDRVALLMQHDSALIASILAVLKSGRMVLTLNTGDPKTTLQQVCDDAAPVMIITDMLHRDLAAEIAGARLEMFCFEDACHGSADHNPRVTIMPDAPAFLLYTSGSTGSPKGVIQNHRNILHSVRGYTKGFGLDSKDRFCLLASPSSGQGVMTTFCALLNGATIYPYALRKRGAGELAGWLTKNKISVFISAASVFRQFAAVVPDGLKMPHLRLVRLGAEPARISDLDECRRITSADCRFAHVLSTTETGNLTQFICNTSAILNNQTLPVGKPVEGKTLLLLGDGGTEVLPGQPGEIVVRSRFLSPGYWRDPAATDAVFKMIPGSDERIYLTGDIGRLNSDGLLEHLGRKDRQHKMLGNRVDLGEIENFLRKHPSVGEVVVGMGSDSASTAKLVAWIVPQQRGSLSSSALYDYMREALPSHMVPGQIILVNSIPRTTNGKVDFNRLSGPQEAPAAIPMTPPRTPVERRVAQIWFGVLGCPALSVYQGFFESGGDSLKAVDLILGLSREFGRHFGTDALIKYPTIAQFAEAVETGRIGGAREAVFRRLTVSLLSLREGGSDRPLLSIPGGYTSEDELLIFASLTHLIEGDHPSSGVRLNLRARRVLPPLSLTGIARKIGIAYLSQHGRRAPIVIGECRACPLACETAQWLARKLGTPPPLVLLDPWHPRQSQPRQARHWTAMPRYLHLLRDAVPRSYRGEVRLICAKETGRLPACKAWWSSHLNQECIGYEVPGNHLTYLREHRASLAASLNSVLKTLGAE